MNNLSNELVSTSKQLVDDMLLNIPTVLILPRQSQFLVYCSAIQDLINFSWFLDYSSYKIFISA